MDAVVRMGIGANHLSRDHRCAADVGVGSIAPFRAAGTLNCSAAFAIAASASTASTVPIHLALAAARQGTPARSVPESRLAGHRLSFSSPS